MSTSSPAPAPSSRVCVEEHSVKALVIACNTATAAAIHLARGEHPELPMVGVEPALKPAVALSRTRRIGVMATRGTLASAKFRALHDSLEGDAQFVLQACDGLADAIQNDDAPTIAALCAQYTREIGAYGKAAGQVDTLVLGCTHYAFAAGVLASLTGPDVRLIETGEPVARQTRRLLAAAGQLRPGERPARCVCWPRPRCRAARGRRALAVAPGARQRRAPPAGPARRSPGRGAPGPPRTRPLSKGSPPAGCRPWPR